MSLIISSTSLVIVAGLFAHSEPLSVVVVVDLIPLGLCFYLYLRSMKMIGLFADCYC